jgi:hypothetical protein
MSIARDVASLALSGSEVTALYTKGFYLTSDLELLSPIDLANETGLSKFGLSTIHLIADSTYECSCFYRS